ncbi:MAG: sigma-70 family RNA polymerase sigma factor [Kofleriaceae bacterium]
MASGAIFGDFCDLEVEMDLETTGKYDQEFGLDSFGRARRESVPFELGAAERRYIHAVARKFVRDDDDAQDVAQDAMLQAFRHRASFRGESQPRTWLYRIAATTALSFLRRRRRQLARQVALEPGVLAELPVVSDADSPETALARQRVARWVRGHLAEIPEGYRRVLELRAEDASEQEISQALGLTVATVKIRGHRARARLRTALIADAA